MKKKTSCPRVDIGGQAVMEGVMMRSPDRVAIAVRRPNGKIVLKVTPYVPYSKKHKWMGWPFIRGIISFITMLSTGLGTLQDSTDMLGALEEEPTKFEKWLSAKLGKSIDKIVMATALVLAIVLSVGLFFVIPEIIASALRSVIDSRIIVNLLSGVVRIAMLIGYILFCRRVPDVARTFRYHGAEHKTVYCNEARLPLTPENAKGFSTLHPRCGTSFLLIVFVLSILLFTVAGYNGTEYIWRLLSRLALLPFVAGISYEVLKGLAHSDAAIVKALRWPGLQLQRLTTSEPDESMLEIAICAMNCALYGMPEDAEKTPEGWGIVDTYHDTEKKEAQA